MSDRDAQDRASRAGLSERRVAGLHPHGNFLADEAQGTVADQGSGQQAALAENLKAIANPEDELAFHGGALHRTHHRREPGNRPGPQVVTIGESAGNHNGIKALQSFCLVPDVFRLRPHVVADRVETILITIRAGETEDSKFHRETFGEKVRMGIIRQARSDNLR